MALISCPECGGKISSVADGCVHCGCKIITCPDCGKTYAGEPETCSECGFNFKKSKEIKTGKGFKGILDFWKANAPSDKVISRLIPIILAVIGAAFIAFMIMAVTSVLRLGHNEDPTKLFKIGISVTVAVIFSVIFFVLLIATNVLHSAFIPYRCGAWIRDNGIDVSGFVSQLRELPKSKRTSKNNREIRSAYVAEYPRELSKIIKISSVCGLFYIVCFIITCVFLNEAIDTFIVKKAFSTEEAVTLVGVIDWILLLIPVGIIVLSLATEITFRVLLRRKVSAWLGVPEPKIDTPIASDANTKTNATSTENNTEPDAAVTNTVTIQPEISSETITDTKTEAPAETVNGTVPDTKTETPTETANDAITDTKSETPTETVNDAITDTKSETPTETVNDAITDTKSETPTDSSDETK